MAVCTNSGQICSACSRPFVAREIHDEFARRMAVFSSNLKIGRGIDIGMDIEPVVSALPFATIDEVVTHANATPYSFAAGFSSTNLGAADKLAHRLESGFVWVNMDRAIDPENSD